MNKILMTVLMIVLTPLFSSAASISTTTVADMEKGWNQVKLHFLDNVSPITLYNVPSSSKMLGLVTTVVKYKALLGDLGYVQSLDKRIDSAPVFGLGLSTTRLLKAYKIDTAEITPKAKIFDSMKLGVFISKPFNDAAWMWGPYIKFQLDFE